MGPYTGRLVKELEGIVVDDDDAILKGAWTVGTG